MIDFSNNKTGQTQASELEMYRVLQQLLAADVVTEDQLQDKFTELNLKYGDMPLTGQDSPAMEGFWQDLLRWGPFGPLFGAYLHSLGRIRKVCSSVVPGSLNPEMCKIAVSLYLPDYDDFQRYMAALQTIAEALKVANADITKFKPESIVSDLKKVGLECTIKKVGHQTSIDWRAIVGSWLGCLACWYVFHFGIPGNILGGHFASKQGKFISKRGWDIPKLEKACSEMTKLVDVIYSLQNVKSHVSQQAMVGDPDFRVKLKFVKQVFHVLMKDTKTIGRGLASAIFHCR